VKYIHVARDGRDASMSFHNHAMGFTEEMLENLDNAGLADETVARAYPRILADPALHFHRWLTEGAVPGHTDGSPSMSFFHFEQTWWAARHCPNVLLVHYNDLKSDLSGEMHRIADFLGISIAPTLWAELVKAASFEAMRRDGDTLLAKAASQFKDGSRGFFFKGTNERWRGVFRDEDLRLYDAKLQMLPSRECAQWVNGGRHALEAA
jgi:aryl sulfotransferase